MADFVPAEEKLSIVYSLRVVENHIKNLNIGSLNLNETIEKIANEIHLQVLIQMEENEELQLKSAKI